MSEATSGSQSRDSGCRFAHPGYRLKVRTRHAPSLLVVRATVSDPAKRAAFDAWYANEHMPDAVKTFGAEKAWRYWSVTDPALHQATYQFPDKASLDRATTGEEMKRLVADFNRDRPDVTRTREILVLAEEFGVA